MFVPWHQRDIWWAIEHLISGTFCSFCRWWSQQVTYQYPASQVCCVTNPPDRGSRRTGTSALWWRHNGRDGSQINSLTIVYSTVYSGADQRKHQSSASLAFVRGIHRWPVNSPYKWPVTRKMFPFDDVIMVMQQICHRLLSWWYTVSSSMIRNNAVNFDSHYWTDLTAGNLTCTRVMQGTARSYLIIESVKNFIRSLEDTCIAAHAESIIVAGISYQNT